MTEKRFTFGYVCGDTGLIDNKSDEWFIENCCNISDLKKNWIIVCDKLNALANENEQLKKALKNSYLHEICETCKYGHYFLVNNFQGGCEGDFECTKKHFGNEDWKCDGLKECDDYELDLKRFFE